jgi:hypothetical protein
MLLIVQLLVFLVALPGFGIETRSFTQYAAWAGPIFLALTVVLFAAGIAGLVTLRRPSNASPISALTVAVAALLTVLLDDSHVAGPPPPAGPLVLSVIAIVVSALLIVFAYQSMGAAPGPAAPVSQGGAPPT